MRLGLGFLISVAAASMALAACSGDTFTPSQRDTNGGAAGAAGFAGAATAGGAGGDFSAGTGGGETSAGASGSGTAGAAGESAGAAGAGTSGAAGTGAGGSIPTGGGAGAGGDASSAGSGGAAGNPTNGGAAGSSAIGGAAGAGGSQLSGPHLVFVLSKPVVGAAVGGLSGADQLCKDAAEATTGAAGAPSLKGRAWRAWLSSDGAAARDRITPPTPGALPEYRLVDGETTIFAEGTVIGLPKSPAHPLHAIDQDERGLEPANPYLWTGTKEAGTTSGSDCDSWGGLLATSSGGGVGKWSSTNAGWTADNVLTCTKIAHLLCFEVRF
jgi:hypothetical protein